MPSLGIAPRPGGCAGRERMPMQDVAPVSDVFPADGYLHRLEIGIQAVYFFHRIARIARRTAPYVWTQPPLSWHALVPHEPFGMR